MSKSYQDRYLEREAEAAGPMYDTARLLQENLDLTRDKAMLKGALEAADEQNERLRAQSDVLDPRSSRARILELEAENEQLRAELETNQRECASSHIDEQWRDEEVERLRAALEHNATMLDKAQAIMRKHGFKFETRLDLSEGFEKLAFTFYTLLCEVDAESRRALEGSSDG